MKVSIKHFPGASERTSSHAMDFVLDEEVDERHQSREERPRKQLAIFQRGRVARAQGHTAQCPWQCRNEV